MAKEAMTGLDLAMIYEEALQEQVDIAVTLAVAEKEAEYKAATEKAWEAVKIILEKAHRDSLIEELEKIAGMDGVPIQVQSAILERIGGLLEGK